MTLQQHFRDQQFANGYELVDGVRMHAENGARFQIPHNVLRRHVRTGYFVELRIDSPRFSVHEESVEKCYCISCSGKASKPILGHSDPASLVPVPRQNVPSRGWGEDFWAQVTGGEGPFFKAAVDNPLYESRLHELQQGGVVYFHEDHILAVHSSHRQEIVQGMDAGEINAGRVARLAAAAAVVTTPVYTREEKLFAKSSHPRFAANECGILNQDPPRVVVAGSPRSCGVR